MRKEYIAPEAEIERFTIADICTQSTGIGEGGEGVTIDNGEGGDEPEF